MRTLVTGGAGFIGSHLVRRLVDTGVEVVVLDNLDAQVHDGQAPNLPAGANFLRGDVGDAAVVDRALEGVDRVVHLAAAVGVGQSMYEIQRYVHQNTLATATFLERLVATTPRPSRLVVASSMSIYGEGEYECPNHGSVAPGTRPEQQLLDRQWECLCPQCGEVLSPIPTRETKLPISTSVYAVTKRDHEDLCLVVGAAYAIPTVALRFFNVYGPGQALSNPYTGVAAIFASRLLNQNPPIIFEDGEQTRDFIHVSDIVEGIVLALESEEAIGHALNLGGGLNVDVEPKLTGRFRSGDIRHCYADPSRARELLGFSASLSLEDGMHRLTEWLAGQEAEDRLDSATDELVHRGLAR
jgi:dTDP-L-rhamnose 4-epimerase